MVEPKTIYLEPDEEVTSVIDKLRKTEFKEVVLVVPKEAGLLHSIVNLKLIKRQAEALEKSVSLVTQDKVGRNLAEKVGLATAAKVGQEPKLKEPEEEPDFNVQEARKSKPVEKDDSPLEDTNEIVYKKPANREPEPNEIVVSEADEIEEKPEKEWRKKPVKEAEKGNIMPTLPKKKLIAVIVILAIVLLSVGFIFLPRAKATILVQGERRPVSLDFSGEKNANVDTEKAVIPTQVIEATKESSKKYTATGKKDAGEKATGEVRIANFSGRAVSWVAGTRFSPSSNSSLIYRAVSAINIPDGGTPTISVQADQPGDKYNGFGNNQPFILVAGGSPNILITSPNGMSGGTTKEVTYVTQGDYDAAKSNLSKEAMDEARSDFNKQTEELKVIDKTKKEETVSADSNPAVGDEASDFEVSVKVSVKALAYNMNDVTQLIKAEVERQLATAKQIIDDGASGADVTYDSASLAEGKFSGTVKTDAYVSSKLDENQIKTELVGDNESKATEYLKGLEGVDDVNLQFWPSFIKYFPRVKNHIYIKIEVSDNSVS